MPTGPIDPATGPFYALEGRVVTMDAARTVLDRATVYVEGERIRAVVPAGAPPPDGMAEAPLLRSGGTIYPGLVELHNHLSYNVLPLWQVPRRYEHRGQWRGVDEARAVVGGPMHVLGLTPGYVPAIARYAEAKCLVGGTTTSQGISLVSNQGIKKYFRGVVRNVEHGGNPLLPAAGTRVEDPADGEAQSLLDMLELRRSPYLIHLAEGVTDTPRRRFAALRIEGDRWAINRWFAAIHGTALRAEDFAVLAGHEGSLVWSPLSNLLLYGETTNARAAAEAGVRLCLGCDWSPTGSKNLLGELKVAKLVSDRLGGVFDDVDLVAMVTANPAATLGWDAQVGSVEAGKLADLLVLDDRTGDPYARLVNARETAVKLVVIGGVPRYGQTTLMGRFGVGGEDRRVGASRRTLFLEEDDVDPVVGALSLGQAEDLLADGLARLPELLPLVPQGADLAMAVGEFDDAARILAGPPGAWYLDLSEDTPGMDPFGMLAAAATPLADLLVPLDLDPLTVADDGTWFQRLANQPNLARELVEDLARLYGETAPAPDVVGPVVPSGLMAEEGAAAAEAAAELESAEPLAKFLARATDLSLAEKRLLVDQALVMLQEFYVHLPLKSAMHAVEPIQRLRLLRHRLDEGGGFGDGTPDIAFHVELTRIFTDLRDLHTNYLLPRPFSDAAAFLPYFVEACFDAAGTPRYIVSKVVEGFATDAFGDGVEALHWNGVPMARAVALNAEWMAGSNEAASLARGLDGLTMRPMIRVLPPDEEWVTLRYRGLDGVVREITHPWRVVGMADAPRRVSPDAGDLTATALGYDIQTDAVHQVKKRLLVPRVVALEAQMAQNAPDSPAMAAERGQVTTLPTVFRAEEVDTASGRFGLIRIFTFNVPDADAFIEEFVRLAEQMPQTGLILDVRGNGGGSILAAEGLLQVLTPRRIEPEPAQFINSAWTRVLCERHAPSTIIPGLTLAAWTASIKQSVTTGAVFSRSVPIVDTAWCNLLGQRYYGPVVLITDALCYSATDMFAAGFKDHGIGTVLGTAANTGAGGANVWTHTLLLRLLLGAEDCPLQPLPRGAGMRVAIRRTLRAGEQAGTPVEDLGVTPDVTHRLTSDDLLHGNRDLFKRAGEILAAEQAHALGASVADGPDGVIKVAARGQGLDRIDLWVDDRPVGTEDVDPVDSRASFEVKRPGGAPGAVGAGGGGGAGNAGGAGGRMVRLELRGFALGELKAAFKREL